MSHVLDEEELLGPAVPRETEEQAEDDDDGGDLAPDFRVFASMLKKGVKSQDIRRGEKDFESHGTRAQTDHLEASRAVMEDIQAYTRSLRGDAWNRGWYAPDYWQDPRGKMRLRDAGRDAPPVVDNYQSGAPLDWLRRWWFGRHDENGKDGKPVHPPDLFLADRVVCVEMFSGAIIRTVGKVVPGVTKYHPAFTKTWLLPEEALFLVERGNLDLWWPDVPLEALMPGWPVEAADKLVASERPAPLATPTSVDDYAAGVPLSVQAAYALLVGRDGERGRVSLEKYQVYAHLKRAGYHVLPAWEDGLASQDTPLTKPSTLPKTTTATTTTTLSTLTMAATSISEWLSSIVQRIAFSLPATQYEALVKPGLYHSYRSLYQSLALIPRYHPYTSQSQSQSPQSSSPSQSQSSSQSSSQPPSQSSSQSPFRVHYFVWKSSGPPPFSKGRHRAPDFRIAVVDARDTRLPTLDQLTGLLAATPWDPPPPTGAMAAPGRFHQRIKHGYRNVLLAVVDNGIISFSRFSEMAFGLESQVPRMDLPRQPRMRKRGGRRGGKAR